MEESNILATILLVGAILGFAIRYLVGNIIHFSKHIKDLMDNNKEFAKKQAMVAKMKADGDFHEWITIPTPGGSMLVCKKTGFCPELNGFVAIEMINSYLNRVKQEEEYKVFRDARVLVLAKELGLDVPRMEEIVEKVFSMKKDFTIHKLAQLQQDLTKRAEDVNNPQN
jgi:hypothetical protein